MASNLLKDFRESIDSYATIEDVMKHIAHSVVGCGCEKFVDGVGPIQLNKEADGEMCVEYQPQTVEYYIKSEVA